MKLYDSLLSCNNEILYSEFKQLERIEMEKDSSNVLYGHLDREYITIVKGNGVYVFDENGKRYLDAVGGGVGVANIGYGVKEIVQAITEQAKTLAFIYGGSLDNRPRQELAGKLQQWAPEGMGETKTFFCSGGAEANESALKIAHQYHRERGKSDKRLVIGRWQSYHGNTIATLSMGGRTQWRRMYSSYLLNFPHIVPPYCFRCPWGKSYPGCELDCAYEMRRVIRQEGPENVAAFIAEPITGTSMAAVMPPPEYYPIIRSICDEYDVLFIADEVLTGIGRTGEKWGINHWQVAPDIITTAKGLSGGYSPLAAVIIAEKVWRAISSGSRRVMHSYTFGGNPLSCAAGVATLRYIEEHNLISRSREMGSRLLSALQQELAGLPCVGQVRGKGLLLGVELVMDKETKKPFPIDWKVTRRLEKKALENGLLILGGMEGLIEGIAGDHIQLSPPYVIENEHVDFIVNTLSACISALVC